MELSECFKLTVFSGSIHQPFSAKAFWIFEVLITEISHVISTSKWRYNNNENVWDHGKENSILFHMGLNHRPLF